MGNSILSIVIILLILSLITEKITELIKLNIKSIQKIKFPSAEFERNREKKISMISILVGIIVSSISNADFFNIIENSKITPWKGFENFSLISIIGYIITGVFISQGSKFFHDLLDTLLYIKNIKKSLYINQENLNNQLLNMSSWNDDQNTIKVYPQDRDDDYDYNN